MKRLMNTLGSILLTILVILLIGYGWAFIEIKIRLKPQPSIFGYAFFQVKDNDMVPDFNKTDVVIAKQDDNFKAGDVILYLDSKDSTYKAHYVVSTNENETVTKCAICESNNAPISNNNVVGRAIGKVYFLGSIIQFFKNKVILAFIGIVGLTFLVISQYMEFKPKNEIVKGQ